MSYAVSRYLTLYLRDAARDNYPHFTLAHLGVVASNPIWGSDFSEFPMGSIVTISFTVYIIIISRLFQVVSRGKCVSTLHE